MMNKKTIVVASNNKGKIKEIKALLPDIELLSLSDIGVTDTPEETENTFIKNALIKARHAKAFTEHTVIADDSGLEVFCLDNMPGVFSKRLYVNRGGKTEENMTDLACIDKLNLHTLLEMMENKGCKKRDARFVCVIALINPDGTEAVFEGQCRGKILTEPKGSGGFGYDPVFLPDGYDKTFAEMDDEQKNGISHRANALRKLKEYLDD